MSDDEDSIVVRGGGETECVACFWTYGLKEAFDYRAQLQREKQGREDAEKEKKELTDHVRKIEMEAKRTHDGTKGFHVKPS